MTKQELIAHLERPATVEFTFMPVSKVIELLNLLEELDETPSVPSLTMKTFQI